MHRQRNFLLITTWTGGSDCDARLGADLACWSGGPGSGKTHGTAGEIPDFTGRLEYTRSFPGSSRRHPAPAR